jgi:hypothetical protein
MGLTVCQTCMRFWHDVHGRKYPAEEARVPICWSEKPSTLPPSRTDRRTGGAYGSCICSLDADRSTMSIPPTVLYPLTLAAVLRHVLTTQAGTFSTTLIVCSSRDTFLQHLSYSLQHAQSEDQESDMQDMISPSLHNLLTTRHVKLAFCASVQALLAYLTICGLHNPVSFTDGGKRARIVVLNPLSLHASTLSFSAQGLSRTFAAATETALKVNAILQVVECRVEGREPEHQVEGADVDMNNGEMDEDDHNTTQKEEDPWDQEVAVLNVSTRRFGSHSGERAWAGRTVKAKRIAARWFRFQKLDDHRTRDGQG